MQLIWEFGCLFHCSEFGQVDNFHLACANYFLRFDCKLASRDRRFIPCYEDVVRRSVHLHQTLRFSVPNSSSAIIVVTQRPVCADVSYPSLKVGEHLLKKGSTSVVNLVVCR